MRKPGFILPMVLTAVLGGILVYGFTYLLVSSSDVKDERVVEIPEGAGLRQVANLLGENGIISNERLFVILSRLMGAERQIQTGEYRLSPGLSPFEILDILRSGRVVLHSVTVPEGYTMAQIAALLNDLNLVTTDAFMARATDAEWIHSLGIQGDTAEGYLFPETYNFPKSIGAEGIIRTMVASFRNAYTDEIRKKAEALYMTETEVVTLASIIEKETSVEEERRLISAVFHNRLKRRIPLQSDPTVIYALPDFDGNLKLRDLRFHSPYNTYWVSGLPPGPIASPGKASLMAAVDPEPADYYYFVSRNDGTHHFSRTLAEHNKAVERYQKKRRNGGSARMLNRR
jgi:UPF0755 protein